MSNANDLRPDPVIPVLVPWLRGQPSRRPYVVMRRAEEHYRELLVFLKGLAMKGTRDKTAPTTCDAGFAHNKVMIVASSLAELEAVRDEAIKADIAGRLESLKGKLEKTRVMLKIHLSWRGSIVEYVTREQANTAVATLSNLPWLEEFDTMGPALVAFVILVSIPLFFLAQFAAYESSSPDGAFDNKAGPAECATGLDLTIPSTETVNRDCQPRLSTETRHYLGMNQDQFNQLFRAIAEVKTEVAALKTEVAAVRAAAHTQFNVQEQRLGSLHNRVKVLEDTLSRLGGQSAATRAPRGRGSPVNQGHGLNPLPRRGAYAGQQGQPLIAPQDTPRVLGSKDNAGFLPFAIELIEKKRQSKPAGDNRTCYHCHKETFSLECFRVGHFHWCRSHQRPIIAKHEQCGKDYQDCLHVKWEVHPQWEMIVEMSFAAGLGSQGVQNLREKLFPRVYFPAKYNNDGTFNS